MSEGVGGGERGGGGGVEGGQGGGGGGVDPVRVGPGGGSGEEVPEGVVEPHGKTEQLVESVQHRIHIYTNKNIHMHIKKIHIQKIHIQNI